MSNSTTAGTITANGVLLTGGSGGASKYDATVGSSGADNNILTSCISDAAISDSGTGNQKANNVVF